jgi:hypothetical protein
MWIFLKDAFLSVVKPTLEDCPYANEADVLAVRARRKGEIEAVFPKARVKQWKGRDYSFRAFIPRQEVANAIAERVMDMQATNFKGSVDNEPRHDAYLDVWRVMWDYQNGRYHQPKQRRFPVVDAYEGTDYDYDD